jgi:hypothetical protein
MKNKLQCSIELESGFFSILGPQEKERSTLALPLAEPKKFFGVL